MRLIMIPLLAGFLIGQPPVCSAADTGPPLEKITQSAAPELVKHEARDGPPVNDLEHHLTIPGLSETLAVFRDRLHGEQFVENLNLIHGGIVGATLMTIGLLIVYIFLHEIRKKTLVIQPFDVPPAIGLTGYSPHVIARRLHDKLTYISNHVITATKHHNLVHAGAEVESNIVLPVAQISLLQVFTFFRNLLGNSTYVDGELTGSDRCVHVTVRVRGRPERIFTGKLEDLNEILLKAADYVYLMINPYILAVFRRDTGDLNGAVEAVKVAILSRQPQEVGRAYNLWGLIQRQSHDFRGAINKFETGIRLSPRHFWAYENLAQTMYYMNRWGDAEKKLKSLIKLRPRDAVGYALLGQLELYRFDVESARHWLSKALRRNRHDQRALGFMALLLYFSHDYRGCLAVAERMVRLEGRRQGEAALIAPSLNSMALAFTGLRAYETAREYAQQLVDQMPSHAFGWSRMSAIELATGNHDAAISCAKRALELGPQIPTAPPALARALAAKGDHQQALDLIEGMLLHNSRSAPLYLVRGDLLLKKGCHAEAVRQYQKVTTIIPTLGDGYDGLGRALAATNDSDGALRQFKKAVAMSPKWSVPRLHWGDVLASIGDSAGAIAKFQEASQYDPLWAVPHTKLGNILEKQGNLAEADSHYKNALELDPQSASFVQSGGGMSSTHQR